jgi:Domain of unknown function (DUF4349)
MNGVSEARLDALVDGKPAVSYDELRFVETIAALRGGRVPASDALRQRVHALADEPRATRWALPWRGMALAAAPAVVAIGLGAAVVHGVLSSGSPVVRHGEAAPVSAGSSGAGDAGAPVYGRTIPDAVRRQPSWQAQQKTLAPLASTALAHSASTAGQKAIPPSSSRLQAYDAYLRLRVRGTDSLSHTSRTAMQVARSLGGYVAFVNLDTARSGDASLRLRVPIGSVQTAISRLSGLGTIVAQSFTITDLQHQADQQLDAIAVAEGRVGRLALTLRDLSLSPERRARLELALAQAQRELRSLRAAHQATVREGRLATISVGLTTRSGTAPAAPSKPGRIHRALDDAASVLGRELAWLLYLAIILAPLALLVAAGIALARFARRRGDRAVLEA